MLTNYLKIALLHFQKYKTYAFINLVGLAAVLAAFTAEQRAKEIGVRKTLDATVGGIVVLLSKDLLRLVALAFVVATPTAFVLP